MRKEASRTGFTRSVGEIVGRASHPAFKRFGFTHAALISRWAEIVGDDFARHTRPETLRPARGPRDGGTLELRVTGAFAPRLAMVEPEIVTLVNRFLGYPAVVKLRLLHGLPAPEPAVPAPAPAAVPAALEPSLKAVADPDLRASLEALARALATAKGPPVL